MAANTSTNLIGMDFADIKQSLISYLSQQDLFKDYDFTGSNMNVLMDILSYNTFHNNFYLNMIGNEMFLDTSLLRDSAVSHAKELNYTPRSFKSSKAVVNIDVQANTSTTFVQIPKNTQFSSTVGANTYIFTTDRTYTSTLSNNEVFSFTNIEIFEGTYLTESYVVNYSVENQRYIISNQLVDIDSLMVIVSEDNNVTTFERKTSLLDLNEQSEVYFVQACENDRYEIIFGNNIIGRRPKNGATVIVEYRPSSGELPNGAFVFQNDRPIGGFITVDVATLFPAAGGAIYESIEEIKFNAPRAYTTQERAVNAIDYEILLKQNFPEINALAVFGGEEVTPPVYGKVYIAADLIGFDGIPDYKKQEYTGWLKNKTVLTIEPVFIDPEFVFGRVKSTIRYNANVTDLSPEDISSRVAAAIASFNRQNYSKFNAKVRLSKLLKVIDDAHPSIVSSFVEIFPYIRFQPALGISKSYELNFKIPIVNNLPKLGTIFSPKIERILTSTKFMFEGKTCEISDDNAGVVSIVSLVGDTYRKIKDVGTIDYALGKVVLSNINIQSYVGNEIKLYVYSEESNFDFTQNVYFEIKEDDIETDVQVTRE
jgi:hypothetical protein